jgi:hypothetical protein
MRLSRPRVERLAWVVVQGLKSDTGVRLTTDEKSVATLAEQMVMENMRQEEEIDTEARELLLQHAAMIQREGIDQRTAFIKVKGQLAKQKGFVI